MDRPVPISRSCHGLSLRGRDRCGHRRIAETDRDRRQRLESDPGTAFMVRLPWQRQSGDRARRWDLTCRCLWTASRGSEDPRCARARCRRSLGLLDLRPRLPRGGSGGHGTEGPTECGSAQMAAGGRPRKHDRSGCGSARTHRVLADCRRLENFRRQAPVSHRYQPRIGCPRNVERRSRPLSGDARLDEPVGQLPERPFGRPHGPRLADVRRDGSAHPSRSGAACSPNCPSLFLPP